jgi:hypothetical protein
MRDVMCQINDGHTRIVLISLRLSQPVFKSRIRVLSDDDEGELRPRSFVGLLIGLLQSQR